MDVHVHILGRDLDPEKERGPVARMDGGAVSGFRRAEQERDP